MSRPARALQNLFYYAMVFLVFSSFPTRAQAPEKQAVSGLFDADRENIWNQIYNSFHVRAVSHESRFAEDDLDSVVWPDSDYLRSSPSQKRAERLLYEFLSTHAEDQVQDPLRRAIFQRELWAAFDQLSTSWPGSPPRPQGLLLKLAQVIRRVALTQQQIEALPDNYNAAAASNTFPTAYDQEQPYKSFLPHDLLDDKGPWVALGKTAGVPIARQHEDEFSRSIFLVFLRLPGGRQATLSYLRRLNAQPKSVDQPVRFPAGTEVALLRRMMMIDRLGHLRATPLTESLQIRVYREVPETSVRSADQAAREQHFFEILLSPELLLKNSNGGLRGVAPGEMQFAAFRMIFPVEVVTLAACAGCHSGSGVQSFGIGSRFRESVLPSESDAAIRAKLRRSDWTFLKSLWSEARD